MARHQEFKFILDIEKLARDEGCTEDQVIDTVQHDLDAVLGAYINDQEITSTPIEIIRCMECGCKTQENNTYDGMCVECHKK